MGSSEDERNVDEQLDEQQRRLETEREKPRIENHANNTRGAHEPSGVIESDASTTVTDAAKGTQQDA